MAIPGPQMGYLQEVIEWLDRWMTDEGDQDAHKDAFLVYVQDGVKPKTTYDYREGKWLDLYNEETSEINILKNIQDEVPLLNRQQHGLYSGVFCPFGQEGDLPDDQLIDNALATSFMLPQQNTSINIVGQPIAKIRVKSDKEKANLHVRVTDVHPTGEKTLVTKGQLNLNHYKSHEFPENLTVDEYIDVEVPLDVIGYQIEAGHNIEVSISPTYWPQIWPDKEIVNLIVDFSHSELLLPVINDFNEVRLKYEQSETAAPLEKEIIRDGYRTRNIIKKLTTDEWVLDDFSDEGLRTLTDSNITYGSTNRNVYTIKEGDPLSAKVECDWTVQVKDSDIDTNVVTKVS